MPKTRTFVDTNVLIAAFHDQGATGDAAEKLLADSNREFVASDIVRLELLPKPDFFKQHPALSFYEDFFNNLCTELLETTPALVKQAEAEARQAGLSAGDALHVAAAKQAGVAEFVTAEKATKPLFRVQGLTVTSIRQTP